MPKLVDYAARFEFIREAVCAVVDRGGAAALTQRSVAEELGISLTTIKRLIDSAESLPSLGLELVQRERRNRARSRRDSGLPRAVALLLTQLPTDEESLAHACVWESVTSAHSRDGRVREFREAWSSELDGLISHISDNQIDDQGRLLLRAVFDGLLQAVIQRRVELEAAHAALRAHLDSLGDAGWLAEAAEAELRDMDQREPRMTVYRA